MSKRTREVINLEDDGMPPEKVRRLLSEAEAEVRRDRFPL